MSAGEFLDLEARSSRICPECGIEVSIVRPQWPLSATHKRQGSTAPRR
jgi:hypothetical protein